VISVSAAVAERDFALAPHACIARDGRCAPCVDLARRAICAYASCIICPSGYFVAGGAIDLTPKSQASSAHPVLLRGAYRDRHGRWFGMRWTRRCCRRTASTRTAKSCGPDIATLVSSLRSDPQATVAKEPVAGVFQSLSHARLRVLIEHPAFPAPSLFLGASCKNSGVSRRENADGCLPGYQRIAPSSSLRAKRSNPEPCRDSGLLRRFAPRNDGECTQDDATGVFP
jgi:hypothetical protein